MASTDTTTAVNSFNNTPQAKDDVFTFDEAQVAVVQYFTLNVMANDLGGGAKTMWSIDDGVENEGSTSTSDLLAKEAAGAVTVSEEGAQLTIVDGKVQYGLTTALKARIDALDGDETFTDSFTYAIRLGNGTLSWATATVTISGQNDAAQVTVTNVTDTEADASAPKSFLIADQVTQVDPDAQDAAEGYVDYIAGSGAVSAAGTGGATPPASGFSFDAATGQVTYDQDAFNFLDADQSVVYTITFQTQSGDDAPQSQTLTLTITGQNDAAQVTVTNVSDTEADASSPTSFLIADKVSQTDADDQDTAEGFVDYVPGSGVLGTPVGANGAVAPAGGLTFDAATGQVTYDQDAFNFLDADQSITYTITFDTTSGDDAAQSQSITVTITGQNDTATITVTDPAAVSEDAGAAVSFNVADHVTITDADTQDAASPDHYVNGSGSVLAAGPAPSAGDLDDLFSFDAATGAVSYDPADFNWLDAGQSVTYTITFKAQSGDDGEVEKALVVTVTGANDAAQVTVTPVSDTEADASNPTSFLIADQVSQTDADDQDTADGFVDYVANSGEIVSAVGSNGAVVPSAALTLNAATGEVSYDPVDFNFLDADQSITYTLSFDTKSGDDDVQAQSITVTITGQNDVAQVTVTPVSDTEADASSPTSFLIADQVSQTDADDQDAANLVDYVADSGEIVSAVGANGAAVPSGALTLNAATGEVSYDPADFNFLDADQSITYTLSFDTKSGDDDVQAQSITVTITGQNDVATITVTNPAAVSEDAGAVVTANVADYVSITDADTQDAASPDRYVDGTGTVLANGPTPPTGTLESRFSFDADTGAISYDPADFNWLGAGQQVTYTIDFKAQSGDDGQVSKTLVVTISGANDAPSITSATTASVAENATAVMTVTSSDPDAGDTAAYAISGGADAALFAIDPVTGALSFVSAPNFEAPGDAGGDNVYNVQVQVTDANGLTGTRDVAVTVTDVTETPEVDPNAPVANDDLLLVNNGAANAVFAVSTLLGNDSDPNSDTLTITSVTGAIYDSVKQTITYSGNGGTFTYTASDGNGNTDTATVTVQLVDPTIDDGNNETFVLTGDYQGSYIDTGTGADTITGGGGVDTFVGGAGKDIMTGSAAADTFVFNAAADTTVGNADVINGFVSGTDKIHLTAIDARTGGGNGGEQDFLFGGETNVVQAYSVVYYFDGTNTHVLGDTNGSGAAEFEIILTGDVNLTAGDFFL